MNNSEYWARRFKLMEDALQDEAYDYVQNLERRFNAAIRDLNTQMRAWYQRFADNNGISYAEAKKLLKSDELEEFSWTVQEYIEKGRTLGLSDEWVKALENASARVHISRLDALKYQLRQLAEELTQERIKNTTDAAKLAYTQSYYHTAFEIQRGFGVGWTMQALDDRVIEKVLSRPWTADNQTFTARCWADKAKLVETVNRELTRMVATGAAPDKAIERIAKQFKTSKSNAGRVVMTESAYFASAGQKDCFNELGVEQYRIVSALDLHTCEICGDMDGRVYKMSEFAVGSTAPPFHPWCRCCTAPYFADMEGIGERYARDVETGKSYTIPKDITYKEWKAQQDAAHGAGTVDRKREMRYNKAADEKQYARYKESLGKNAPKTFSAFQEIKYSGDWESFKAYARAVKSGELTALADFDLYKSTSTQIDKLLVGQVTSNGITVTGKSYHFIARTIGSVEQKRSGVRVEEILQTITQPIKIDPARNNANGKSQKFMGETVAVTINPDTGTLIQVNPFRKNKAKEKKQK